MPSAFSVILREPKIRIPAVTLVALAFTYASTLPYQSIIGINELGIWSDRMADRRPLVLMLSVCGMIGFGSVFIFHTAPVFILCVLLLIPASNSTYSILFASIRATTNMMDRGLAGSISSTVRALYSGSWALAPGVIGLYLATAQSMTPAYGIAGAASLTCFCLYFFFAGKTPKSSGPLADAPGFLPSLRRIVQPHILKRIIAMSLLLGLQRLNTMLSPLIITHPAGGTVVDVGFMAGLVAFLEMPFMMMWGTLQKRFRNVHILAAGALIYCLYLTLAGFASAPWHIYSLVLINACGAAAILSVPITYLQDLIADRPGLGSSLISVSVFISNGVAATIFAIGTTLTDYSGTAQIAALAGLGAIAFLLVLESGKRELSAA